MKGTLPHRSHVFKALLHVWAAFIAMLIYQTFDATFVSFLAAGIYVKANIRGEIVKADHASKIARPGEV